ncbi:MAG: hypothetical protein AAGE83_12470, partial [Pseudomonadota bacterium]
AGPAAGHTPESLRAKALLRRDTAVRALAREAAILCSIRECAALLEPAAAEIEDMTVTSPEMQALHAAALNRVVGIDTDLDEERFAEAAKLAGARPFSFLARLSGLMTRSTRPSPVECQQIVLDALTFHHAELAREAERVRAATIEDMEVERLDLENTEMLSEEAQADHERRYGAGVAQLRAVIEERDRMAESVLGGEDGESSAREWQQLLGDLDLPDGKKP